MPIALTLLIYLAAYWFTNFARLLKGRSQPKYLHKAFLQTSEWLAGLLMLVAALAALGIAEHVSLLTWSYLLAVLQLAVAGLILLSTLRHLKTTKPIDLTENYSDQELPTASVCIPARNETDELEACLRGLLASTYPKLEILVLDDCSQNKRTPEIIRSFAHDGVRFVAGKVPPEHWLAKNYAYHQLSQASSGDLLLFCGADTRFEPEAITNLVRLALQKGKSMVGLLPRNLLEDTSGLKPFLVQPTRYAWEMALPRRLLKRPPVLSTCWLISRSALERAGGFTAVKRKVVPVSYFARQVAMVQDGYSFVRSSAEIAVTSAKAFAEQRATAIRVRYPQLHKRPEMVALTSLAEFAVLILPLVLAVSAVVNGHGLLAVLAAAAYAIQTYVYGIIVNLTYRRRLLSGYLIFPLAVIYDLALLNYSMWQYEFGEVIWKGRNVCLPVMQATPSLPKPSLVSKS